VGLREGLFLVANAAVRGAARAGLRLVAALADVELRRRIAGHGREQARLRRRYRLEASTPIRGYDDATRAAVEAWAAGRPGVRFATTSGSTAQPKRIAYTRARLAAIRRLNLTVVARIGRRHRLRGSALFVLTGLAEDDSLSSLLLGDRRRGTRWLAGLVMPAAYLAHPAVVALAARHGATAVRLWLWLLSDPGLVYATNPSTLALFLGSLHEDWRGATAVARAHLDGALPPAALEVARRVVAPGWRRRLELAATSPTPPPAKLLFPGLGAYCCWDGGYVRPFLETVQRHLPGVAHVPMYSMSTETLETLLHYDGDTPRYLPLAPGVCYELLPEDEPDDPARLLPVTAATAGGVYALVVSDAYGLVRYQTEDLFRCVAHVGGLPDLRFVGRRGLGYSFTGEKLTAAQVLEAARHLAGERPVLEGVQLCLVPYLPPDASLPRYRLVLAHGGATAPALDDARHELAARFDALLGELNAELRAKQASGRLGATEARVLAYDELAARLDPRAQGDSAARAWEGQFKVLPIYRRLWGELGLPA
jgi:hypothetical protein